MRPREDKPGFRWGAVAVAMLIAAWAPAPFAGEFTIAPLRVTLDRGNRASEISVRNEGTEPLRMQIQAMSWRQDSAGKDQYEPAEGLVYFPRALEIPPGESRLVRVGIRAAPVTQEETYRLFVEELPPPGPASAPTAGATVRVFLRVGVPVFVAPAVAERKIEITRLEMKGARAEWTVANQGNVHVAADRVQITASARDGTPLLTQQVQERYFLAGATRPLRYDIAPDLCRRVASVEVSVTGEDLDLRRRLDVGPGSCN